MIFNSKLQKASAQENRKSLFSILSGFDFTNVYIIITSILLEPIKTYLLSTSNLKPNFPQIYVSTKDTETNVYTFLIVNTNDQHYMTKQAVFRFM